MREWYKMWKRKVQSVVEPMDDKAGMSVAEGNHHDAEACQAGSSEMRETLSETAAAVQPSKSTSMKPRASEHRIRLAEDEYMQAVERCNKALADWKVALHKLDWVNEQNQIDYAIYSVIAAEKHYATTLKEAKRLYRQLDDLRKERFS